METARWRGAAAVPVGEVVGDGAGEYRRGVPLMVGSEGRFQGCRGEPNGVASMAVGESWGVVGGEARGDAGDVGEGGAPGVAVPSRRR